MFTRVFILFLLCIPAAVPASYASDTPASVPPLDSWQEVVRGTPYWTSQGVFANLSTIRRWVLMRESYCEQPDRHILFDRQARFLAYLDDEDNEAGTQTRLNQIRAQMAANKMVENWAPGAPGVAGYPFALSCNQPEANLNSALVRYTGQDASARLWGTWDGMRIGTPEQMVSLHDAVGQVYRNRVEAGHITMPDEVLSTLAGKILIESGGRPDAHSAADARGVMQLLPVALADCGLAERHHFHRMAQIDCALRLLEKNHRNLQNPFSTVYGHLPERKQKVLYAMLLLQAYHGGAARVTQLLTDPEQMRASEYFARHHERFSAGDIALGMIYHNLGRDRWGFASLYYVTDVGIAVQVACRAVKTLPGCVEIVSDQTKMD